MKLAERRTDETLSDWATRALDEAFGPAVPVPCLNRACEFYQDETLGGVAHNISDHIALAEIKRYEARFQ